MTLALNAAIIAATKEDRSDAVISGSNTTPWIFAYRWTNASGFGTKYADPTVITGNGQPTRQLGMNSAKNVVGAGITNTVNFMFYKWDSKTGFGTRFAAPATAAITHGDSGKIWHPRDDAVLSSASTTPFIEAYHWDNVNGFGTKYAAPVSPPAGNCRVGVFTAGGGAIVLGTSTTGGPRAIRWSASGFGTLYSAPVSTASVVNGISTRADGKMVYGILDASPYVGVWPWSDASGFGTRYGNPATAAFSAQYGTGGHISKSKNKIGVSGSGSSPYLSAYRWTDASGFGTKFTAPTTPQTGTGVGQTVSSDDQVIATNQQASPWIYAIPWTATGYGAKYANPTSLYTNGGFGITFN